MSNERVGATPNPKSIGFGPLSARHRETEISLVRHLARIAAERDEALRLTGRPLEAQPAEEENHDH